MIGLCSKLGIIILGCFTKRAQLVMSVCKQLVVMVHKLSTTSSGIKEPEGLQPGYSPTSQLKSCSPAIANKGLQVKPFNKCTVNCSSICICIFFSISAKKDSWRYLLHKFTQETTFHGVRYITDETPFITRRQAISLIFLFPKSV